MYHGCREKFTGDRSSFIKKYLFDHTRSCCLHLPNEQPDSQALLRLFVHSLPSCIKTNHSSQLTSTFFELYYQNELESIIGKNCRHFDFRLSFVINQSDKKEIFMCTGISINDFVGWIYILPFQLLINLIEPLIIRNMRRQSMLI